MIEGLLKSSRLLVVSDDSSTLGVILTVASANRWVCEIATDAWGALDETHGAAGFDLLVLDMPKPPADALQILRVLQRSYPSIPVVLIGYPDDLERKQDAVRLGVSDYLARPLDKRQLEIAIRRNLPIAASAQPLEGIFGYKSLRSLLQSVKEETEKSAIALALEKTGWNRKAAARLLKTSYRSVLYKIEQYRMNSPDRSAISERTKSGMAQHRGDIAAGEHALEFQRAAGRFDE